MGRNGFPLINRERSPLSGRGLRILLFLLYLPLLAIFGRAFIEGGAFSLRPLAKVITSAYYGRLLLYTLIQAFLSALFSLLLALPAAAFFVHFNFPFKGTILSLTTLSFLLPPILVVLGFVIFWGNSGTVNRAAMVLFSLDEPPFKILYSFKAIILAHLFYNIPLALRFIYAQWSSLPRHQYEAAVTQGTNRSRLFIHIVLPQIRSSLLSSFLIIFLYCFMSFAIILVLGGGPKFSTLEVEVYRLIKNDLNFADGGALALGETFLAVAVLLFYFRAEAGTEKGAGDRGARISPRTLDKRAYPPFIILLLVSALFFGGPLVSLIVKSFQQHHSRSVSGGFTLEWYARIFTSVSQGGSVSLKAVVNSLRYAFGSSFLALVTGTAAAYGTARNRTRSPDLTEFLILLPMGISSIVMAMGYLLISSFFPGGRAPGDLFVILAHAFISLPFVYRSVKTALDHTDPGLREAALIAGANERIALFHIELPLIRKALINGGVFAFSLSMGEVNAVLILASPDRITLPLAIYRLIGIYRYAQAAAMGSVLMATALITFLIMGRFDDDDL